MSIDFFRTLAGRKYYEVTLPAIVRELGRLADNVAELNKTILARRENEIDAEQPETECDRG